MNDLQQQQQEQEQEQEQEQVRVVISNRTGSTILHQIKCNHYRSAPFLIYCVQAAYAGCLT
jgi:hypothetical protein